MYRLVKDKHYRLKKDFTTSEWLTNKIFPKGTIKTGDEWQSEIKGSFTLEKYKELFEIID